MIGPSEPLVLQRKAIHERLAPVVDGARAGSIGRGKRVYLSHEFAGFIEEAVTFIADLVVVNGKFPEMTPACSPDQSHPTASQLISAYGIEIDGAFGLHDDGAEQTVVGLEARVAVAVEVVGSLRLIFFNPPFVGHALTR